MPSQTPPYSLELLLPPVPRVSLAPDVLSAGEAGPPSPLSTGEATPPSPPSASEARGPPLTSAGEARGPPLTSAGEARGPRLPPPVRPATLPLPLAVGRTALTSLRWGGTRPSPYLERRAAAPSPSLLLPAGHTLPLLHGCGSGWLEGAPGRRARARPCRSPLSVPLPHHCYVHGGPRGRVRWRVPTPVPVGRDAEHA
ncbi:bile salt-activated lipase-like [Panicum virgatum]|uniref:bile salt-activated lipase-like n=1 Tax=Panicum virgatum TaxID=38727 RepID=UPI0019D548E3|nr:bile salt-activated lipase-like [Panicum virgatum]